MARGCKVDTLPQVRGRFRLPLRDTTVGGGKATDKDRRGGLGSLFTRRFYAVKC